MRRRRNNIDVLKNDNGVWLYDKETIGKHILSHFKNLFARCNTGYPPRLHGLIPELITDDDNLVLCVMLEEGEIWQAVRSIGPLKASGPDGFTAIFYQKYWDVVKSDVVKMSRSFFENGFLSRQMNHSHIVLIPKGESPNCVGNYRQISLCNVAYKIISKILATRLRRVLPKLISGNQNAFVLNWNI